MFTDVGILGYIVLYSLNLYNVSDETLQDWNTPDKDITIIKNVLLHTNCSIYNIIYILGQKVS